MNNPNGLYKSITDYLNGINTDALYYDIISNFLNDYSLQDMLYCSSIYDGKTIYKYTSYKVAWESFVKYILNKQELPQKVSDTVSAYLYFWAREGNNSDIINRIEKYFDTLRSGTWQIFYVWYNIEKFIWRINNEVFYA